MGYRRWILGVTVVLVSVLLVSVPLISQHHYLIVSLFFMFITFLPFFIRFEKRKVSGREMVMLAVISAIAAVSRIPFASIPSVQPTTFVIIVAGIALGAESGFVIGALAAIVSNLFLGQGPWTPWQMYSWGMIGLVAGLLRNSKLMNWTIGRCFYGFVAGIFFGWIMNLWYIVGNINEISIAQILAFYGASLYFDLAHALSNVFFLAVFGSGWIKVLIRFRRKYGLLNTDFKNL